MAKPMTELVELMIEARDGLDGRPREERLAMAARLGAHGVLSKNQVGKLVNLPSARLADAFEKTSKTGGRFDAENLELIKAAIDATDSDGKGNDEELHAAWKAGTSIGLLATLTGLSLDTARGRIRTVDAKVKVQGDE